jgi:hypothetical protein
VRSARGAKAGRLEAGIVLDLGGLDEAYCHARGRKIMTEHVLIEKSDGVA